MLTKGSEEDQEERRDLVDDEDTDDDTDSTDLAPFEREDSMNETSPVGRDIGNDE